MVLAMLLLAAQSGRVGPEEAERLVEKLRSESVVIRDGATRDLKNLGEAALAALEKAARDPDRELSGRAAVLIRIIMLQRRLSPELRKGMPGIEDRLASGGAHEWTVSLREADARRHPLRPVPLFGRSDLEPLALEAARGASTVEEWETVCRIARERGLAGATTVLVQGLALPTRRESAAKTLGALRCPESFGPLARLLGEPDPNLRSAALELLAEVGAREHSGDIALRLEDPDPRVRARAATVLAKVGARDQAHRIALLLLDGEPAVRRSALGALGVLGGPLDQVPTLVRFLDDPDPMTRRLALQAIAGMKGTAAVPEITRRLPDPGSLGRVDLLEECFITLLELGALDKAISLLGALLDHAADPALRARVTGMLRRARAESHAVAALTGAAQAAPALRREQASLLLGELESPNAVAGLQELIGTGSPGLRWAAVRVLLGMRIKEALPAWIALLGNSDAAARESAAHSLATVDAVEAVPALRRALADPSSGVRRAAGSALLRQGVPIDDPELLGLLEDEERSNRVWIIRQLADRVVRNAVPRLRPKLSDPEPSVRRAAVRAAARLNVSEAIGDILKRRADEDPGVRAAATEALGEWGAPEAVPVLLECLADDSAPVQEAALEALANVGAKQAAPRVKRLQGAAASSAAVWLLRMGDPDGAGAVWKSGADLCHLNRLRAPETWSRLTKAVVPAQAGRTRRKWIESAAGAAGLSVRWPAAPPPAEREWLEAVPGPGDPPRAGGAAEWLRIEFLQGSLAFVLEGNALVVMDRGEECRSWEEWCAKQGLLPKSR